MLFHLPERGKFLRFPITRSVLNFVDLTLNYHETILWNYLKRTPARVLLLFNKNMKHWSLLQLKNKGRKSYSTPNGNPVVFKIFLSSLPVRSPGERRTFLSTHVLGLEVKYQLKFLEASFTCQQSGFFLSWPSAKSFEGFSSSSPV